MMSELFPRWHAPRVAPTVELWFALSVVVPLWTLGGYIALLLFDPTRGWRRR